MPDFSIKIVPVGHNWGFQPDLPGAKPGDPLIVPPQSLVTWANETQASHQMEMDNGSFATNRIYPGFSSDVAYVTPNTAGTITYHCSLHPKEKGSIVIQDVGPMPPIKAVLVVLLLAGMSFLPARAQDGSHPGQHRGQHAGNGQVSAASGSQISCQPTLQPLVRIPEIVSDPQNHRLRATMIAGTDQVRIPFRYPLVIGTDKSQPGQTGTFQACFPQWVRTFRSPDTTTAYPGPSSGYDDPLPGPTLRARVGDFIELTFLNEIDPLKFGQSIDQEKCDAGSPPAGQNVGYPQSSHDMFPDCFHGSTTANLHFHGTHTNPTSTGDDVFLEILSSKRLVDTPAPPPPNFDSFFAQCEVELSKGTHVEWPVTWSDLPSDYTASQTQLLQKFDQQPNGGGKSLWAIDEAAIKTGKWPQYYIGSFPYCYRLPQYPAITTTPRALARMDGMPEMEAHQGHDATAVMEQGGDLRMGQSPGTHWYHAHKHGSTTIDISNGFLGAFIIEGQYDDEINRLYQAYAPLWTRTQPVLVLNQFGTSPNLMGGANQDKGPDFSVNGRTNPVIAMRPGEVQMWRILNGSARAGAHFSAPTLGLSWKVLARDGVQLYTDNYTQSSNKDFLLAAGNRIDLLVQAPHCSNPDGCTIPVQVKNEVDPSNLLTANWLTVATIKVAGSPISMPFPSSSPAQTFPQDLSDITDDEIKGTQIIDFTTTGPNSSGPDAPGPVSTHMINGKKFDGEVGVSVLLNKVEEWKVTNNALEISHPFHIHINPFQVTEVFAPNSTLPGTTVPMYVTDPKVSLQRGQCRLNPTDKTTWKPCGPTVPSTHRIWWDVFSIPSGKSVQISQNQSVIIPGYFKMRSRFVDFPGWFVIHCHILAHEDRGMMTVVEVTPLIPPYSHH